MLYLPEDGGVWVYKKELEDHAVSGEKKGGRGSCYSKLEEIRYFPIQLS